MESNKKEESESRWSKFVSSFDDYMSTNPLYEMDEMYMTESEKLNMYREATEELKLKLKIIREKKDKKDK